jgi:NAD(P)H-dependent FMN reductase
VGTFAFRTEPIVAVAHSGRIAGGVRAIEHLAQIATEAELVPSPASVVIPGAFEASNEDENPLKPVTAINLRIASTISLSGRW